MAHPYEADCHLEENREGAHHIFLNPKSDGGIMNI